MSTLSIDIPNYLHKQAEQIADKEGVSINQFVAIALAEKLSMLMTNSHLEERAKQGDKNAFQAALVNVADDEPPEYDKFK